MPGPHRSSAGRDGGLALLGAILAVALLTIVVLEASDVVIVQTRFARNAGNAVAAQLLARSAEIGAEALLIEDARGADAPKNTAPEGLWATPFEGVPTEIGGTVGFAIADERARIDVNVLAGRPADDPAVKLIRDVFTELRIEPSLVDTLRGWVSGTGGAVEAGIEGDYCRLPVPCAPRHVQLPALEELRVIRGFDARTVAALRASFTAIPGGSGTAVKVNVNTASPTLLRAMGCEAASQDRPPGGWTDLKAFVGCKGLTAERSDFFRILARGTMGDTTQTILTVVRRSGGNISRRWWRENPLSPGLVPEAEGR